VKAMLAHVDEFRPVHNLEALADLCASLDQRPAASVDPRRWLPAGDRHAA
ncbi:MAG: VWA domain-containing protein, partial [Mesorhizobium sp.]